MTIISRVQPAQDIAENIIVSYYMHELRFGTSYVLDTESKEQAIKVAHLIEGEEKRLRLYLNDVEFGMVIEQIFIQLTEHNDKKVELFCIWGSDRHCLALELIKNVVIQSGDEIFKYFDDSIPNTSFSDDKK